MIQLKFQRDISGDRVKQRWQREETGSIATVSAGSISTVSATDDRDQNQNSGNKNRTEGPVIKPISRAVSHHLNAHIKAERTHVYTRVAKTGDPEGGEPERGHPTKRRYFCIILSLLIMWKILFINIFSLIFIFHKNSHRSLLLLREILGNLL